MTTKTHSGPGPAALRRALADIQIEGAHVEIVDGCVHLYGVAPCYAQKRLAAEVAETLTGLPVTNEIRVALSGFAEDERLLREVQQEIARLGDDVVARVHPEVNEGVVVLRGTARDAAERELIARAAAAPRCVVRVENRLQLPESASSDEEIARALDAYITRAMNLPPGAVIVTFEAGLASLTGSVPSQAHRDAIEELVRWHDGVRDVRNGLRVSAGRLVPRPRAGAQKSL